MSGSGRMTDCKANERQQGNRRVTGHRIRFCPARLVDLPGFSVDHGGVPADPRPSYEDPVAENAELREMVGGLSAVVTELRAEVAELRRQLGQNSREFVE